MIVVTASLQLTMEPRFLALFFGFVVLLSISEETWLRVVLCKVFARLSPVWLGASNRVAAAIDA